MFISGKSALPLQIFVRWRAVEERMIYNVRSANAFSVIGMFFDSGEIGMLWQHFH